MKSFVFATLLGLAPLAGVAGTIDTTADGGSSITFNTSNGADAAGGSFFADADTLVSFTLDVFSSESSLFRAVVFGFGGGTVPSTLLWESADTLGAPTSSRFTFTPGISLVAGDQYLIGIDNGNVTTVAGNGLYGLDSTNSDQIPGGVFFQFNGATSFTESTFFNDISSRIVMEDSVVSAVPLPASIPLLGGAFVLLAGLRRKRSKT